MTHNIDFKGGKINWNIMESIDFSKPPEIQDLSEDLLTVDYENFFIDLGWYRNTFVIHVIKKTNGEVSGESWNNPWEKAFIQDINDLLKKLQSTIDYWVKNYGPEDLESEDEFGHLWGLGWEDSDRPHPGFGTYGAHVGQCMKCGMYSYEFSDNDSQYKNQKCHLIIRK